MNTITFINFRPDRFSNENLPLPSIKVLPEWYKKFPKYFDQTTHDTSITISTLKNCAPFFDAMSAGYMLTTPCDLYFYEDSNKLPNVDILDDRYKDFVELRPPMEYFPKLEGYHDYHFHWLPDWGIRLEQGYSAMYVSPLNMYELPFLTTNGIVDNDNTSINGKIPFFIKKGFSGIIKKGTPFLQIIPIKRESWKSETELLSENQVIYFYEEAQGKYRDIKSEGYKNVDWVRKHYE